MRYLIVGSQRSGTTMLASALARSPDLVVFDEPDSYFALTSIPPSSGVFKIPRWGDLVPGPTMGDPDQKLERPWEWRGEPMVHIFRTPQDVVSSMHRRRQAASTWLDRYGVPLASWRIEADLDLARRFGWVLELEPAEKRWACAAAYWVIKNEAAIRHQDAGRRVLLVSFERVVQSPKTALTAVLRWLGVDANLDLDSPSRLNRGAGGTDPQRQPDIRAVGRGAELPSPVKALIQDMTADLHTQLSALEIAQSEREQSNHGPRPEGS